MGIRKRSTSPDAAETPEGLHMIFADHAEVIPLLEKAAACPDYDAQFDYSLPPKDF